MDFDENLAAIHGYLCADGYVIKNSEKQKLKYYRLGLRNTNLTLLKDFQEKFFNYFKIEPHLYPGQRCQLGSKQIYNILTKEFGSFYSKEWKMPNLSPPLRKIWLRSYFDCEGWVFCKTHQNRHIGVDSINESGLNQVRIELERLGIKVIKKENKKRKIFRLLIYGKNNLNLFKDNIGFLHPEKKEKLNKAILDFMNYKWKINKTTIKYLIIEKAKVKKPYIIRICSKEETNLKQIAELLENQFNIQFDSIKINERFNGLGNRYFELSISRKSEVIKLIGRKLINPLEIAKITCIKIN